MHDLDAVDMAAILHSNKKKLESFWRLTANQKLFMDNLANKLNITTPNDWYRINLSSFQQHGATSLLQKYDGSVCKLLTNVYPTYLDSLIENIFYIFITKNQLGAFEISSIMAIRMENYR